MTPKPLQPDPAPSRAAPSPPDRPRSILLVAHPDRASRHDPGLRFVADVLRANGVASLAFNPPTDSAPPRDAGPHRTTSAARRVDRLLDGATRHRATHPEPVALLAIGDAVPECIAAVARRGSAAIRSLVLLNGHPDVARRELARLQVPTLFLVSAHDAAVRASHRAAAGWMQHAHRVQVLAQARGTGNAAGAHEAIACAVTAWLASSLPAADRGRTEARGSRRPAQGNAGSDTRSCAFEPGITDEPLLSGA